MKVLFIRTENKGPFSTFNPVRTEPLEIEYLAAVLNQENHDYRIYDPIAGKENIDEVYQEYRPDVVGIAGYLNSLDMMHEHAARAKAYNKNITVMVGGPHAEVNHTDYYIQDIDIIVHSNGWETFREVIRRNADPAACRDLKGICIRDEKNQWIMNDRVPLNLKDMPLPDRRHFYKYKQRFTYLQHGTTAMMKTSYGCPHKCSFCYAKILNEGKYIYKPITEVVDEIESIDCDQILITDDTFLFSREHAIQFCEELKKRGVRKRFVMYARADFIVNNADVVKMLKDIGVFELIVGVESIDDENLRGFNKENTADDNRRSLEILQATDISYAALFIMNLNATKADFKALEQWMKDMKVDHFTLSIFTPQPGTAEFKKYEPRLITRDPAKWDLIHFVIEPDNMSKIRFYYEIYRLYTLSVLKNPGLLRICFDRFVLRR